MPHSSGGGSHSGGSSSSSSSGGGSHSSSGGGSYTRTSNHYFHGAHAFVSYKTGEPKYVFSTDKNLNQGMGKLRYLILAVYLPFFIAMGIMAKDLINVPQKLPLKYDTTIRIEDNLDIVEDKERLAMVFRDFREMTGITMSLLTTSNETWEPYYYSLEDYAYEQYLLRYPDESHWLIIYTSDMNEDFNDWHFEGMQGDDTDNVLTTRITTRFNETLTKYLLRGYPIDKSIEKAIADIDEYGLMKPYADPAGMCFLIIVVSFLVGHMALMLHDPNKKYRDYIRIPKNSELMDCEYCGSSYYTGTVLKCPNCGAPVAKGPVHL